MKLALGRENALGDFCAPVMAKLTFKALKISTSLEQWLEEDSMWGRNLVQEAARPKWKVAGNFQSIMKKKREQLTFDFRNSILQTVRLMKHYT